MVNVAIPYLANFKYNSEVNEFNVKFNNEENSHIDLIKFLGQVLDKRINVELVDLRVDIEILKTISKIHSNIYFRLNRDFISRLDEFKINSLRFFFNFPAYNWDTFNSIFNSGASDIYVTDDLGFYIKDIKLLLNKKNIKLRTIVNLAQFSDPLNTNPPIKSFFIRPEDINIYGKYIDTFEFYHENNAVKLEALYEIYIKQASWFGDLEFLISNLRGSFDNKTIMQDFGNFRINCKRKCYQGGKCRLCDKVLELSNALQEKGLVYMPEGFREMKEDGS